MAEGTPFYSTTQDCCWAHSWERTSIHTKAAQGTAVYMLGVQCGHSESFRRPGLRVCL